MDKIQHFYYYKITCKITGLAYIGISTDVEKRWQRHRGLLRNNKHHSTKLQNAWNKYGEENFVFEIIDELDTTTTVGYQHEVELIAQYDTYRHGYNMSVGGLINPMYTPEVAEKMIQTKQSQVDNIVQLKKIDLNHFQIINIWHSRKEAFRVKGYDFRNICHSIEKHTLGNGFYWVEESKLKEWRPSLGSGSLIKEVDANGNIIQVYESQGAAERAKGLPATTIAHALMRNGITHGYKFERMSEQEFYELYPIVIEPVQTIPEA